MNQATSTSTSTTLLLHVCERCSSDLVNPSQWDQAGPELWAVTLDCPNCGHSRSGTFSQETVDAFDAALDDGYTLLLEELRQLTEANMADEIARFVAALEVDALLPEDF